MPMLEMDGMDPVIERFVGKKHKEFQIIENEMKKIITMIKKTYRPPMEDGTPINDKGPEFITKSDHNKLIERQFQQLFGLKGFRLMWIRTGMPNAITPVRTFTIFSKGQDKETGMYKNKNLNINTFVDVGLITYAELDEKEIIAIILHEIGHNFYNSVFHLLASIPLELAFIPGGGITLIIDALILHGVMDLIDFPEKYSRVRETITNFIYKYAPVLKNLYTSFVEAFYNVAKIFRVIDAIDIILKLIKGGRLILNIASRAIFGFHSEKFSDKFAAEYGYGLDLAKALNKMEHPKNNISVILTKDVPGINWTVDFLNLQMDIITMCLDEHPASQTRIRSNLDQLKRNYKRADMDPQLKEELKKQIDEYEKFYYNEYLPLEKNENKKKVFTWLYKNAVEKVFAGKLDPREILYAIDPHKYS